MTFCDLTLRSGCVFAFRFQAPDLEVQLSDELAGSLRTLKVCVAAETYTPYAELTVVFH